MDEKMENAMETSVSSGFIGIRISQTRGTLGGSTAKAIKFGITRQVCPISNANAAGMYGD